MSAICGRLASELQASFGCRVTALRRLKEEWVIETASGQISESFDAAVISAPAPQAAELLWPVVPALASRAAAVEMAPCWSVLVSFDHALGLEFDAAFVRGGPLTWVARNASKPGRPTAEDWVLHGSPDWSRAHLQMDAQETAERLLQAFRDLDSGLVAEPAHLSAHRWRYALPEPLEDSCLFDAELELAVCGDWCGGPRVEGAFLSGLAAADAILGVDKREG
jgi:predicted NAD/FAD-dependent oxidoreductase